MRVISGSARGRKLKGPPSSATRPMADKIKGALFNSLASLEVEPEAVLDCTPGPATSASRRSRGGPSMPTSSTRARDQCAVIRDNLETTGFATWPGAPGIGAFIYRNSVA